MLSVTVLNPIPKSGVSCPFCNAKLLDLQSPNLLNTPCEHVLFYDVNEFHSYVAERATRRAADYGDLLLGMGRDGYILMRRKRCDEDQSVNEFDDEGEEQDFLLSLYQIAASFPSPRIFEFEDRDFFQGLIAFAATEAPGAEKDRILEFVESTARPPEEFQRDEMDMMYKREPTQAPTGPVVRL